VVPPLARNGISNVQAVQGNIHVRQAVTTMPATQFGTTRAPLHPQPVSPATLRGASLVRGSLPVVPTRQSLNFTSRAVNPQSVPAHTMGAPRFFTTHQPPDGPQPFTRQVADVRQAIQTPPSPANQAPAANRAATTGVPTGRPAQMPAKNEGTQAGAPGSRSFGGRVAPPATPAQAGASTPTGSSQPAAGWRRFGNSPAPGAPATEHATPAQRQNDAASGGTSQPPARPAPSAGQAGAAGKAQESGAHPGWQRFGATPGAAPQENSGRAAPPQSPRISVQGAAPANSGRSQGRSEQPAPAPREAPRETPHQAPQEGSWQRFTPKPQPKPQAGPAQRNSEAPRAESAPRAWNRSPSPAAPRSQGASESRAWQAP